MFGGCRKKNRATDSLETFGGITETDIERERRGDGKRKGVR
jgi:hypothetical protein